MRKLATVLILIPIFIHANDKIDKELHDSFQADYENLKESVTANDVRTWLKRGGNPNAFIQYQTALDFAVMNCNLPAAEVLVGIKAHFTEPNRDPGANLPGGLEMSHSQITERAGSCADVLRLLFKKGYYKKNFAKVKRMPGNYAVGCRHSESLEMLNAMVELKIDIHHYTPLESARSMIENDDTGNCARYVDRLVELGVKK
jgi:hypothetical protein